MVMAVLASLMVAACRMAVPLTLLVFSVRMDDRSALTSSVSEASLRIASLNVSTMFVSASLTVSPLAGANDTVGAVVSGGSTVTETESMLRLEG